MSVFQSNRKVWFKGFNTETCNLDPKDFLYCKDEDYLNYAIKDYILENSRGSYGTAYVESIYNTEYEVPKEFFTEWKKLKNNIKS